MRNPILLNVPEEFFTERLHIRMPRPGDGKLVHEAICASQEELKQWLSFASKNQSVEDVEIITREAHSKFLLREHLRFFVFQKNTRTFIATISYIMLIGKYRNLKLAIGLIQDTVGKVISRKP